VPQSTGQKEKKVASEKKQPPPYTFFPAPCRPFHALRETGEKRERKKFLTFFRYKPPLPSFT
jgi:hypothetical protein